MKETTIATPESLRIEHTAIHRRLEEATRAAGAVGSAARALAAVLHPHFVREEEIAMPPLGLLASLAAGDDVPAPKLSAALAMTESLKAELAGMLREHAAIRAAIENLRAAAGAEGATQYERLAEQLALHARTEEEILYPAALLVGEIVRTRMQNAG